MIMSRSWLPSVLLFIMVLLMLLMYVGLFIIYINILPVGTMTTTSSKHIGSIDTDVHTYQYQKCKAHRTSNRWNLSVSDNVTGKVQKHFQDVTRCNDLCKQHQTHHTYLTHGANTVEWWVDVHFFKVLHYRRTSTKPTQHNHMGKVHNKHEKVIDKKCQYHTFNRKHSTKGYVVIKRYTRKKAKQAMCNKRNEQHTDDGCND